MVPETAKITFKQRGYAKPPVRLDEIEGVTEAYLHIFVPLSKSGRITETLEFSLTKSQVARLSQLGLAARFTVT